MGKIHLHYENLLALPQECFDTINLPQMELIRLLAGMD
jgi:hypothetical protein